MRDFEADRRICDAATKGPWKPVEQDIGDEEFIWLPVGICNEVGTVIVSEEGGLIPEEEDIVKHETVRANAAFIAASRDGWPKALKRIAELEAENAALKDTVKSVRNAVGFATWIADGKGGE